MDEIVISIMQTLSVAREVFPVTSYPLTQGGEVAGRARCLYFFDEIKSLCESMEAEKIYIKQTFFSEGCPPKLPKSNPKVYVICAGTNRSSLKEFQANVQIDSTIK